MDKNEFFEIICNLIAKYEISLGEIKAIQQEESEKISSIENIFDMSSQNEVDLLVALIYLLNDEPDDIYDWFIENHKDCEYLVNSFPTRNNHLFKILIAAFLKSPLFFSMAWNWNIFNLNSIADSKSVLENVDSDLNTHFQNNNIILFKNRADLFHNQNIVLDYPIYASAAGTFGFNNITRIPIDLLGELEIRGNSETEEVVFVLSINEEYQTLKFELTIEFEVNNSMYSATIEKNYSDEDDEVRSAPVQVDFSKGLKFQKISWKAL